MADPSPEIQPLHSGTPEPSGLTPDFCFTKGDAVVVTGAASGIGQAIAVRCAEQGLTVLAWDIDGGGLSQTAQLIQRSAGRIHPSVVDVTSPESVMTAFTAAHGHGPIRHLANVAGPSSAADLEFDDAVTMSLGSMRRMVEAWLATGPPEPATLVNIASVAGNVIGTASDWYSAAKAGVVGYTRHLAAYRSEHVRANAVGPGMVDTPRLAGFAASDVGQRVLQRTPLRRMASADEIALTTLFLLSPLSSYVNGAFLPVDGGWTVTQ